MRWLFIVLIIATSFLCCPLQAQNHDEYGEVTYLPRADIDQWLKKEIAASNGDIVSGRYHFVLAFSTGHYGFDPLHAIAMRRLAFQVINNSCCPGDQLTTAGWEMGLWKISDNIVLEDNEVGRATFVNAVPYTPRASSQGGHDTERSVVDIIQALKQRETPLSSSVILMITSGDSQLPIGAQPGEQLLGEDSREFQEALSSTGLRPPVRQEFTAITKKGPRKILLVAILPAHLQTLDPLAGKRYPTYARDTWQPREDMPGRTERLPNPSKKRQIPWIGIVSIVILCIGAAVGIVLYLRKKEPPSTASDHPTKSKGKSVPGTLTLSLNRKPYEFIDLYEASEFELIMTDNGVVIERADACDPTSRCVENTTVLLTLGFKRDKDKQYRLIFRKEDAFLLPNPPAEWEREELSLNEWTLAPDTRTVVKFKPSETAEEMRLVAIFSKE